ncbi:MAG: hypothetical protein QOH87_1284 [Trebonia sp.]|nr:hypothetical protein [Trebonia sp.]
MHGQAAVTRPGIARTVTIIACTGGAVNTAHGDRAQGHKFRCRPSCLATISTYGTGGGRDERVRWDGETRGGESG